MTEINSLLILPRLRVQAANAVSGPLTWGFPSPTAFTGFAHALERRALKRLENRARKLGGDPWRSPDRLWPHFGDD